MANVVVFTTGTNLHGDIFNLAVISEDKALRSGDDNVVYIIPLRKTNNRNTNIQTTEAWSFELSLIELREIGRKATMVNQLGVDARRQLSKFWGSFIETNPDFKTVQRHYSNHFIKLSTRYENWQKKVLNSQTDIAILHSGVRPAWISVESWTMCRIWEWVQSLAMWFDNWRTTEHCRTERTACGYIGRLVGWVDYGITRRRLGWNRKVSMYESCRQLSALSIAMTVTGLLHSDTCILTKTNFEWFRHRWSLVNSKLRLLYSLVHKFSHSPILRFSKPSDYHDLLQNFHRSSTLFFIGFAHQSKCWLTLHAKTTNAMSVAPNMGVWCPFAKSKWAWDLTN